MKKDFVEYGPFLFRNNRRVDDFVKITNSKAYIVMPKENEREYDNRDILSMYQAVRRVGIPYTIVLYELRTPGICFVIPKIVIGEDPVDDELIKWLVKNNSNWDWRAWTGDAESDWKSERILGFRAPHNEYHRHKLVRQGEIVLG